MRNDTLLKVARTIVERQAAFLEQGEEAMQPMILRDVAEAVAMHESTISRVTTGKYMHTPRGIFEFRFFFSSHVSGADGEDVSSTAIRAPHPQADRGRSIRASRLSDAQLAEILARGRASRSRGAPWPSTARRSASPLPASGGRPSPSDRA
ncbi:MAG: hypothetical protein MZV49_10710 [Rhodopseudomonas palustris]|nr:hypothetical protein [Rhodopseudomonas palustris]